MSAATLPEAPVGRGMVVTAPRALKAPVVLTLLGLVDLVGFGVLTSPQATSTFSFVRKTDFVKLPNLTVPSQLTGIVTGVICLALAGIALWLGWHRRKVPMGLTIGFGVVFVVGFLTWAIAPVSTFLPVTGLLSSTLFLAVPLIFGSLSGVICERSGTINVAIEAQLLGGAFFAALTASITNNAWIGLILAPLAGMFVSWILVTFGIRYKVDQIIVGVVINLLMSGLTGYLFGTVMKSDMSRFNAPMQLPRLDVPGLSQIPIIGPVLFQQNVIVYIMYAVVVALQVMVFNSRWGLRMRSTGEHPLAADTVGINVNRTRYRNVYLAGAIAGLGGAFLTVGMGVAFGKDMSAGKGFIALAAMIFGRWSPVGALSAAILFGFADALQYNLGSMGTAIPSNLMLMLPYLMTIFAIAGLAGKVRAPAAEGIAYVKQ